jgi:CRP/FNR family transcriptional regulator
MEPTVKAKIHTFFTQWKHQTHKKGEILFRADDEPNGIFYITSGSVKQYTISKNGIESTVNVFKPVAFFPMSWAITNTPNIYFFEAATDIEVWKAPKEETITFIKDNPDVMFDLLKRVYLGTDGILARMVYLMSGNAADRLLVELVIYAKRFGSQGKDGQIICKITENDIALSAGMTRETVSREIKKLKEKDLVTLDKNGIIVHNLEALESTLI